MRVRMLAHATHRAVACHSGCRMCVLVPRGTRTHILPTFPFGMIWKFKTPSSARIAQVRYDGCDRDADVACRRPRLRRLSHAKCRRLSRPHDYQPRQGDVPPRQRGSTMIADEH